MKKTLEEAQVLPYNLTAQWILELFSGKTVDQISHIEHFVRLKDKIRQVLYPMMVLLFGTEPSRDYPSLLSNLILIDLTAKSKSTWEWVLKRQQQDVKNISQFWLGHCASNLSESIVSSKDFISTMMQCTQQQLSEELLGEFYLETLLAKLGLRSNQETDHEFVASFEDTFQSLNLES